MKKLRKAINESLFRVEKHQRKGRYTMHRHTWFSNAAELAKHDLMGIASSFAVKFDALVQKTVKNELDDGPEFPFLTEEELGY